MRGLRELFTQLASDKGIEIDPEEFDQLGLSDDEDDAEVNLDEVLPGRASGQVELFLTSTVEAKESDGLIWEPIAREGQWAMRPDGKGGKKRVPLKITAGRSKNQRREIGLQDVVDAFDDEAIEHVTVPETHDNKPTENHGYIRGLKIVSGKFKGQPTKFLMGAYDFTEPETKKKVLRGSVPSRSAGFLYDYERTDTGKKYAVVLEHVALTPKPWLRGMPRFGRKLEASDVEVVTMTLSDDGPNEEEYVVALADDPEDDFLATDKSAIEVRETRDEWLRREIKAVLDERETPKSDEAQLSDQQQEDVEIEKSSLQLAQEARTKRASSDQKPEPPRGGGNMAGEDTSKLQLSDEARALIQAAEDRAAAAEQKADQLSQSVDKLMGTANVNRAEAFIGKLKGMGLTEERGFSGMLKEVEQVLLADDGGPALQSDHFADDRNKDGQLTLSEAVERIFGALITAEGTTLKLGEIVKPPSEELDDDKDKGPEGKPPKGGDEEVDESLLSDDELLRKHEQEHPGVLERAGIKLDETKNGGGS